MGEERFEEYLKSVSENNLPHLHDFSAVSHFKSVWRAIRRGHVAPYGVIYPKRPFNNAKHSKGSLNDIKKTIYEQLKHRRSGK
nr:MAG TPA: hypothetical protein [Crassvirales sp.]